MKRIFMRGNPGDFANYVAALTACGRKAPAQEAASR